MSNAISQKPPRVFSEIRPWLQKRYVSLPKRLQRVAEFVVHNPDVVALNTIAVISDRARVTPSALVRFAKAIGYRGFSDMQSVFQGSMRHMPLPYVQRIHHLDDQKQHEQPEQTVLHRFSRAASVSINKLEQQVDEATILQASKRLATARCIYLAGQGRAAPVTTYLHYMFVKMGLPAVLLDGLASLMADKASLIHRDEALVAVSFNPYTANTCELVDICLARQVAVVALTDSTLSPIARADVLHLEVPEQEVGGFRGLSATMCLALCLVLETGKRCSQKD